MMAGRVAHGEYLSELAEKQYAMTSYSKARTLREHTSELDINATPPVVRGTGIVCTIGPASQDKLRDLIKAGMNIARLNFSHGTYEYHKATIDKVRAVAREFEPHTIAIALDTKGPEIRTGMMKNGGTVTYKKGQQLKISCDPAMREKCDENNQYLEYPNFVKSVHVGSDIVIADGNFLLTVKEILDNKTVMATVLNNATIGSRKNCNLPGAIIDLPAVSEKDKADLQFAVKNKLDMVFASFIRKKQDVMDVRDALGKDGHYIKIISKIENHEGICNINEILEVTDGVMVARGDMGMEIPLEKVFVAQKMLMARCRAAGKPVICATQMLESMIQNPRPTRAEITDVGNAVCDGADCVMLSGESASGVYPVEAVTIMNKICRQAAMGVFHRHDYDEMKNMARLTDLTEATAIAAVGASFKVNAAAIIVLSTTGRTAWLLSHYGSKCPIILVTRDGHVSRIAHLYRNLFPLEYKGARKENWKDDIEERLDFAVKYGKEMGFMKGGSSVIFITGWHPGSGATNSMRILQLHDDKTGSSVPAINVNGRSQNGTHISGMPDFSKMGFYDVW